MLNSLLQVASKGDFAKLINVSPGRISQYISEGKLGPDELEGVDRKAKIRVGAALAKLKIRLDPAQRLGNGLGTRLDHPGPPAPSSTAPSTTPDPGPQSEADRLDMALRLAKLEQQERVNRKLADEEKLRAGLYVRADEAKATAAKTAGLLLQAVEQGVAEMAAAIAVAHGLPERDVKHLMGQKFRELRETIAQRMAREAQGLAATLEDA